MKVVISADPELRKARFVTKVFFGMIGLLALLIIMSTQAGAIEITHAEPITAGVISADGRLIAIAGASKGISVYEVISGKLLCELKEQKRHLWQWHLVLPLRCLLPQISTECMSGIYVNAPSVGSLSKSRLIA